MNTQFYQYSVLKYRPSLLLDEQVNIGLLFVFAVGKQSFTKIDDTISIELE